MAVDTLARGLALSKNSTTMNMIAPVYSESSTYTKGELCTYRGKLYSANQDISTPEEWDASHWTETSVATEISNVDYGSPLVASTVADMTDHDKVYVYTGSETGYESGHWYYWDGTEWADGGVYNAVAIVTDPTLSIAGEPADAKAVGDALEEKANIDGSYENMSVGNAEQLISNTFEEDNSPYSFRTSGGNIDIGDREFDELVGGTLAFNQLAPLNANDWGKVRMNVSSEGTKITFTVTNDNSIKFAYIPVTSGHKVLVTGTVTKPNTFSVFYGLWEDSTSNAYQTREQITAEYTTAEIAKIYNVTDGVYFRVQVGSSITTGSSASIDNLLIIDLTLMFGSTIANYIYNLETGTAGAGVAWFKKYFPKDYYPYNAGELISVKASAHKTVGFNAYNNTTGTARLVGGYVYQISGTYTSFTYADMNGNAETITPDADGKFTPTNDGIMTVSGGNATDTCVHLVWDGERDGEWEEYKENTYALDSDLELRGMWKFDENNNLYFDGDIYESDGTVTRKYGILDMGTLTWSKSTGYSHDNVYVYWATPSLKAAGISNILCKDYVCDGASLSSMNNKTIRGTDSNKTIYIRDDSYVDDATALRTALSGVYLVYELATPTTESADPFTNPQIVDDWGTEEYVDERTVPMPVGHNTQYMANLKAKLEMSPNSPDGDGDYVVRQTSGINEYINYVDSEIGSRLLNLEENKADINGYYEGLTSGQTEQILSTDKSYNKVPYLIRSTGGSADVGARETVKSVMYGSVVHNQLVNNGNFASADGWTAQGGTLAASSNVATLTISSVSGTDNGNRIEKSNFKFINNHTYLIGFDAKTPHAQRANFQAYSTTPAGNVFGTLILFPATVANTWTRCAAILKSTMDTTRTSIRFGVKAVDSSAENDEYQFRNITIIDLTQYFGSAQIPDYLYSLEQSESGSGIALLHQWGFLRRPYYAYDAGTFKSSNPSFKTNVGRNLFDIVTNYFERKDSSGTSSTVNVTSHGYIRVIPNMTYRLDYEDSSAISDISAAYLMWYDSEYKKISSKSQSNPANAGFNVTAPSNAQYAKLQFYKSGGLQLAPVNTANPCLWIHWDTDFDDDPYVEYKEWTYPIDSTVDGHGIFKLDANNNLYIEGDTLASDGTNSTNFTTETFTACASVAQSGTGKYYAVFNLANTGVNYSTNTIISNGYKYQASVYEGQYYVNSSHKLIVCFTDQTMTTKSAVDTYLASNPLTILYKLATPTTASKDGFTEIQICDDWGIQYTNDKAFDDGNSDVEIPVGFDSEFPVNLVAKLEMAPESPADGDGDYIVRQTDGQNEYVKLVIPDEIPPIPSEDATYVLKVVVSGGTGTPTWVAET